MKKWLYISLEKREEILNESTEVLLYNCYLLLFTGLEQLFDEHSSLISEARRQLHSCNINILEEHFGRRLPDAFSISNIFKSSCEDVLISRELMCNLWNWDFT